MHVLTLVVTCAALYLCTLAAELAKPSAQKQSHSRTLHDMHDARRHKHRGDNDDSHDQQHAASKARHSNKLNQQRRREHDQPSTFLATNMNYQECVTLLGLTTSACNECLHYCNELAINLNYE